MNHHSHDYPLEEIERISEPKLAKDCLNLEELLKRLEKIPQTTEQEAEEWRRKEKEKERMASWKKRLRESGVPQRFYDACVKGKIDNSRILPSLKNLSSGCLFVCTTEKGKTFSACYLIAKELWNGRSAFYMKAHELGIEMASYKQDVHLIKRVQSTPLLVLDDFDIVRMSGNSSYDFIALLKKRNDSNFLTILNSKKRTFLLKQIEEAVS
jgi:DNA replication protein DnaC